MQDYGSVNPHYSLSKVKQLQYMVIIKPQSRQ